MEQISRTNTLMYTVCNPDQAMSKEEFVSWYTQSCKIRDNGLQNTDNRHSIHVYESFEIVLNSILFLNYLPATGIDTYVCGTKGQMFYGNQIIDKLRDIYSTELKLVNLIRQRAARELGKDSPEYVTNIIDTYEKFCREINSAINCYL